MSSKLITFTWNLTNTKQHLDRSLTNATQITVVIYLIFSVIYEAQNADNARKFGIWFDDKIRKIYAINDFLLSDGDSCL